MKSRMPKMHMPALARGLDRRQFLRMAFGAGGALAAGTAGNLLLPQRAARAADYRALVCLFLYGGNDGYNMVVPLDAERLGQYRSARGALALDAGSLIGLGGTDFGLHPALQALAPVWSAGRLAPVMNAGPLYAPLSKAEYRAAAGGGSLVVPENLFSHSDQQQAWQTATTTKVSRTGWGARACESLGVANPVISFDGNARFGVGDTHQTLALPRPDGNFAASGLRPQDLQWTDGQTRDAAFRSLYAASAQQGTLRAGFAQMELDALTLSDKLSPTLAAKPGSGDVASAIDSGFASLIEGEGLTTSLAAQLYQVAKMIGNGSVLGGDRHIFFVSAGGFDTHAGQVSGSTRTGGLHASLLQQVGDALGAFDAALAGLGLSDQVTLFTQSDFGRTYAANASSGSDHAWGNIQFVMGGAVQADIYGRYPTPVLGGPDDVGEQAWELQGRFIPAVSVDQYAATLLRWFGATEGQLDAILPNLANFGSARDLGFLTA